MSNAYKRLYYPDNAPAPYADWNRGQCFDFLNPLGVQFDPTQSLGDLRRRCANEAGEAAAMPNMEAIDWIRDAATHDNGLARFNILRPDVQAEIRRAMHKIAGERGQ